ncbi:hypothetical protein DL98DRAFT_596050 [Cadophora sp. DSE1049]|nr:hypothetical protein DL98DRAFT_596050 [Cadophora sp. DSE1049]
MPTLLKLRFQYPIFLFLGSAVLESMQAAALLQCELHETRRDELDVCTRYSAGWNTRKSTRWTLDSRCAHTAAGRLVAITGPGPRPREQEIARVAVVAPSDVQQQRSAGPEDDSVTFNRVKMRVGVVFFEVSRIASTFSTGSFLAWSGLSWFERQC